MGERSPVAASDSLSGTFRAEPGGIVAVDDWVEQIGQRSHVDERGAFRARLRIAEIAANVLEHGSKADDFTVTLRPVGADLDVAFADCRAPFDPLAAAEVM
jgi:anti-sigma regulatory factor (Ser/Thr protein kinase)